MKTAVVEVGGLLSVLSAEGVRKQLQKLSGVHHAEVNYVAQSATVHYDEQQVTLDDLRKRIEECGYHCGGEMVPKHLCELRAEMGPSAAPAMAHEHHHAAAPGVMPVSATATPKSTAVEHAAHAGPGAAAKGAAHAKHEMADMMHDMGHARRHVDAGHGPRHAQPLSGCADLFDPGVPLLADGEDVRRLRDAVRYGPQHLPVRRPAPRRSPIRRGPSWSRRGVPPKRRAEHGHAGRAFASAPATSSASAPPSSTRATCSTKRRPCCWCSSCSATGWRCARAPALRTRSAR